MAVTLIQSTPAECIGQQLDDVRVGAGGLWCVGRHISPFVTWCTPLLEEGGTGRQLKGETVGLSSGPTYRVVTRNL